MNHSNNDSNTTMTTNQDDDGHGLFPTFKSSDDIQASLVNNNNDNNHNGWPNDLQGLPPMPVTKRMDYLVWWDYFMSIAYIVSLRSKDPNTQVGACIVNEENRIVGLGYNGMPNNCSDDKLPWSRQSMDPMQTKYLYVCHAEMNAILNKNSYDCKNCTIFVLLFPCNECAKMIIQAGIDRVVYLCDKYSNDFKFKASRYLLEMAKVELIHYKPKQRKIVIDFDKFL